MVCMCKTWLRAVVAVASIALSGCATTGGPTASGPAPATDTSALVNVAANTAQYQPVNYANAATQGPAIIVLPGVVKSNNATFSSGTARITSPITRNSSSGRRTSKSLIVPIWAVCCTKSSSLTI